MHSLRGRARRGLPAGHLTQAFYFEFCRSFKSFLDFRAETLDKCFNFLYKVMV